MSQDGVKGRAYVFVHPDRQRPDGSTGPAYWIYGVNPTGATEIWFGPFIPMRWTHQVKDSGYWNDKVSEKIGKGYQRAVEVPFDELPPLLEATKAMLGDQPQMLTAAIGDNVCKFLQPSGMLTPQRRDRIRRMVELGRLQPTRSRATTRPAIIVSVSNAADGVADDLDVQVF